MTETIKEYNMLKEIFEQKDVFNALCKKYIGQDLKLNLEEFPIGNWNRVVICASGSSKNASEIAKYVFESLAKISCYVEYASEFAHKDIVINKNDLFIAISQSGNTADTFEAMLRAKKAGATTFGITNDVTSKIHTNADYKVLADAGVEKSIAATKSFTAQLLILYIYALGLAEANQKADLTSFKRELVDLANHYDAIYAQRDTMKKIAQETQSKKSLAIVGRNINSAVAMEGALKVKETCYINSMNCPAGEFLHGYFAFLDETIPLFAMLNKSDNDEENYNLGVKNVSEVQGKRQCIVYLLRTEGDDEITKKINCRYTIDIPKVHKFLAPFLNLVALQLTAFETADLINENVDEPRDLIKCVANE